MTTKNGKTQKKRAGGVKGASGTTKDYTLEQLLKAIEGSNGITQNVAKNLKCQWYTAKKYIEKFPEAIEAMKHEKEISLDNCENVIQNAIKAKDISTAKWYMERIGKLRGYGNESKVELDVPQGININLNGVPVKTDGS